MPGDQASKHSAHRDRTQIRTLMRINSIAVGRYWDLLAV